VNSHEGARNDRTIRILDSRRVRPAACRRGTAGRKVPIRIEARHTAKQALYLAWEAEALTAELVPGGLLCPETSGAGRRAPEKGRSG
jgi:hypothetical protein